MAFHDSYITNAGANVLTAVSGGEKLIWVEAKTSDYNVDSLRADEMKALTAITTGTSSDKFTGSGNVTSHINKSGTATASVNCQIKNDVYQDGGQALLFGIWAKTDVTYTSPQLIFVARHGSNSTDDITNITPYSVDGLYTLFINFALRIDDWQNPISVQLTPLQDYYATIRELNDEVAAREAIENRTVTTHKASSTSSGDNQEIYGIKTFKTTTKHSGNILPTASSYTIGENSSSGRWSAMYASTFDGTSFTGTAAKATADASGNTITSYYCTLSTEQIITGVKHIRPTGYTYSLDIGTLEGNSSKETSIRPNTSGYCYIGTSDKKFKAMYATIFHGDLQNNLTVSSTDYQYDFKATSSPVVSWRTNKTIIPSEDYGYNLGFYSSTATNCRRWNYVYAKYLGSSNSHISDAYINNLYVTSNGTSLLNYIKNTIVTNATYASKVGVLGKATNSSYPVIFADSYNTSTDSVANKQLYTDSSSTSALRYNPYTNICYCGTFSGSFSGTATRATNDVDGSAIKSNYANSFDKAKIAWNGSLSAYLLRLFSKDGSFLSTVYISDVIANCLAGFGGTTSYTTSYGAVGTLGLFYFNSSSSVSIGSTVSGSYLYSVSLLFNTDNNGYVQSSFYSHRSPTSQEGTWAILNGSGSISSFSGRSLVLAVRVL